MNGTATNPGAEPTITFSADETRWERVRSDAVEPQRVRVSADGEWKVTRCPWWIEAKRDGAELVLRPRNCGRHRGSVVIASDGATAGLRVASDVEPTCEHGRAAKRRGLLGALLIHWPVVAFFIVACSVSRNSMQVVWLYLVALPWAWIPVTTGNWAIFLGSRKLAIRCTMAVLAGALALSITAGIAAGIIEYWELADEGALITVAATIFADVPLFWWICGLVIGGRWLAARSVCIGSLITVPLFALSMLNLYVVYQALLLSLMTVMILWQRSLSGLLARIPPLGARVGFTPDERRVAWASAGVFAACLTAVAIYLFVTRPRPLAPAVAISTLDGIARAPSRREFSAKSERLPSQPSAPLVHAGRTPAAPRTLLWEREIKEQGAIVVAPGGSLYLFEYPVLSALDSSGATRWQMDRVDLPPSIGPDGTLYLKRWDRVAAVDASGRAKWSFDPRKKRARLSTIGSPS